MRNIFMEMLKKGLVSEQTRPMKPEERFENTLRFDPSHYWKMWRYAGWRAEKAKQDKEAAELNYRMAVLRQMIQDGEL